MGILIGVTGFIWFVWAVVTLIDLARDTTRFVFSFEDGALELDIETPGVYSVEILGAGHVSNLWQVITRLQTDGDDSLTVRQYIINPRSRKGGQMVTGCWYFTAESPGRYTLTLSNLAVVEAKESMLMTRRSFEDPVDHQRLRIVVVKSIKPVYQFLALMGLVVGFQMVVVSFIV